MKHYRGTPSSKGLFGWCIWAPFYIILEERGAAPVSESGRAAAAAVYKRVMSCSTRGLPGTVHVCACQKTDVTPSREVMSRSPFLYCPSRIYLSWATSTINKIHLWSFLANIWRIPEQLLSWIIVSLPAVISDWPADVLVDIVRVLVGHVSICRDRGVVSTPTSVSGSHTQTGTSPTRLPLAFKATLISQLCFFSGFFFFLLFFNQPF